MYLLQIVSVYVMYVITIDGSENEKSEDRVLAGHCFLENVREEAGSRHPEGCVFVEQAGVFKF